jgi:lipopolysaccharide biosynthesis protein
MAYRLPRALVMAHYDPDGIVDDHILYSLAAYRPLFERIVFVSVSTQRMPEGSEHLVDEFIKRDNIGYDFVSWKTGLKEIRNPGSYFEIVFVNDSVYGPFFDLRQALLAPHIKHFDFWGMVASHQNRWHIQSWFFSMRHNLVQSRDMSAFWETVEPLGNKQDIIASYELAMATFFVKRGWRAGALYEAPRRATLQILMARKFSALGQSVAAYYAPPNPVHLLWRNCLRAGIPYAKVELLRSNPLGVSLEPLRTFIRKNTRYPLSLIDAHIQRTQGR